jgi:hypothetical protein
MSTISQAYNAGATIARASYLNEDLQALIVENKAVNGKMYDFAMATLPDDIVKDNSGIKYGYKDDYSSWGYWIARETDASSGCSMASASCEKSMAYGYWVAGYETAASTIAAIPAIRSIRMLEMCWAIWLHHLES